MLATTQPNAVESQVQADQADQVWSQDWRARLAGLTREPAFRRALPAVLAVGVVAAIALLYLALAGSPQYGHCADSGAGGQARKGVACC